MQKISYSLYSHSALRTFIKELLSLINSAAIDITTINVFVDKTNQKLQLFDNSLASGDADPFTTMVNDADRQRDLRFLAFKNYVEACSYRKDGDWQISATQIKLTIEKYGNDLYRFSLPEESAALNNLIAELEQEPLKTAVNTIEAHTWLAEIKQAQAVFDDLIQRQFNRDVIDDKSVQESRKPLVKSVRSLLRMVELQQELNACDALNALVSKINALISTSQSGARLSRSLSDTINVYTY